MEFWLIEENDAIRGIAEKKIKDDVYDFALPRTERFDWPFLSVQLVHDLLCFNIDVNEPLWSK